MSKVDEMLAKELDQANAGIHQRQKGEEKRLANVKAGRIKRAEHLRQLRIDQVETQFEGVRREVRIHRTLFLRTQLFIILDLSLTPSLPRSVSLVSLRRRRRITTARRARFRIGSTRMPSSGRSAPPQRSRI